MTRSLRYANVSAVHPVGAAAPGPGAVPRSRYRADVATMQRTVDEVIQARRDDPASDAPDLLGRMLRTAHPETGHRWTRSTSATS